MRSSYVIYNPTQSPSFKRDLFWSIEGKDEEETEEKEPVMSTPKCCLFFPKNTPILCYAHQNPDPAVQSSSPAVAFFIFLSIFFVRFGPRLPLLLCIHQPRHYHTLSTITSCPTSPLLRGPGPAIHSTPLHYTSSPLTLLRRLGLDSAQPNRPNASSRSLTRHGGEFLAVCDLDVSDGGSDGRGLPVDGDGCDLFGCLCGCWGDAGDGLAQSGEMSVGCGW